ncbi:MAG: glucoamylase family protein [Candidatus Omnitrophota bacterium]|jgi:hypothetical protein
MGKLTGSLPVLVVFVFLFLHPVPGRAQTTFESLSEGDQQMLEEIQKKSLEYFLRERNAQTGLVKDRANNFDKGATPSGASIAATGFGLAAYAVGAEHGWLDRATAVEMTRQTLSFFLNGTENAHGFFYHFLDPATGKRSKGSEASPIDTALLLAGAIFAAEYYEDSQIRELTGKIYERVEWDWMLHGKQTLSMSWSPEQGFNKRHWDNYDEGMIMYLLAIGSPTHPIPGSSWRAVSRRAGSYRDFRLIQMPPLFTHQYSHIYVDFRDQNDGFADYFRNSVNATRANRAFCMDQAANFSSYGPNSWGLSASDGPFGYKAYGAPPGWAEHDGTVAPTACGSSIVFTPEESVDCLRHFYTDLKDRLWGLYGFSDAFNLDKQWFSSIAIGIDQGPLLLMIENFRSGLIWKVTGRDAELRQAMKDVGFKPGTMELPWPDPPAFEADYVAGGMQIDGYLKDWPNRTPLVLDQSFREFGYFADDTDLSAKVRFAWDEQALYLALNVTDDSVIARRNGRNIWQDDLVELYIDPAGDGLRWRDSQDFQIGFRPTPGEETVEFWSWFQGDESHRRGQAVAARGYVHEKGYSVEASVRWEFLGIEPAPGKEVRLSVGINDIDKDRSIGKIQWFFRSEKEYHRFELGRLILKKAGPEIAQATE